jgi:hypothetical protein
MARIPSTAPGTTAERASIIPMRFMARCDPLVEMRSPDDHVL